MVSVIRVDFIRGSRKGESAMVVMDVDRAENYHDGLGKLIFATVPEAEWAGTIYDVHEPLSASAVITEANGKMVVLWDSQEAADKSESRWTCAPVVNA